MARIAFFIDEMFSPAVAQAARRLGLDAVSSHELGRDGTKDREQLHLAGIEERAFVTQDIRDFTLLVERFAAAGLTNADAVMVSKSVRANDYGRVARGLAAVAAEHPEGLLPYATVYLPNIQ